jgi:branched-subunit amino acid transport protein
VSWTALLTLAALSYAFKAVGLVALGGVELPAWFAKVTALLPPALLSALVVAQTFAEGTHLESDARIIGVAAGCVAVWRKAPFLIVVIVAAGTTAAIRAVA